LKTAPELISGEPITAHCWAGNVPAFRSSGIGYDDGWSLVDKLHSIIQAFGIEIIRQ
jgi:hypothetical protein